MPATAFGKQVHVWKVVARPKPALTLRRYTQVRQQSTGPTVATASNSAPSALTKEVDRCYSKLDLQFDNGREAFRSKSNWELMRALFVLHMCGITPLVTYNQQILALLRKVLGATLFKKLLKSSFYGHFVAGETREEVLPVADKLARFGVKSILDYSVESDISQEEAEEKAVEERGCDRNADIFCHSIDSVKTATKGQGFLAIKLTALGRPQLLLKLSETIAQTQHFFSALTGSTRENMVLSRISEEDLLRRLQEFGIKTDVGFKEWFKTLDFDDDGFVDFYDWGRLLDLSEDMTSMFQVFNIKTGIMEPLIVNLTPNEINECHNMMQRLVRVADHARAQGVRIMVDAEQTYFQPAISRLYNNNGGRILNTYQAYLKNALTNLSIDMQLARRENFHFGCKLVRGAYMEQERKRAEVVGYEDPINVNYNATTQMYHRCLDAIVKEREERGPGSVSVMVATHNEESVRYAVQLMKDNAVAPSERTICFAQLYGMCDQVSFPLGQAGFSVYKYLPYGPVEEVLPYLSRRAQENGSLLKTAGKERHLLLNELKRRLFSGQFVYNSPNSI